MFAQFLKRTICALSILLLALPCLGAVNDKIFNDNKHSIVTVTACDAAGNPLRQGSGFLLKEDGVMVTNYHLISDAKEIIITKGTKSLKAEGLIHIDKMNDVVVLKLPDRDYHPIKMGKPDEVLIGDEVYVMSNTESLGSLLAIGIVSSILQPNPYRKIFQIATPASEGSTGGPVFNKKGELIGIVTFLIQGAKNLYYAVDPTLLREVDDKKVVPFENAGLEDYRKIPEHWLNIGLYCALAGLQQEAIDAYYQALRLKPEIPEAYYNLGLSYSVQKKYEEAITAFNMAITLRPTYVEALYNLGVVYEDAGQHSEAIKTFKQVVHLKPEMAEAYCGLGDAYFSLGSLLEAVEAFKQALKIKPDYGEALYNLSITYGLLGKYAETIEACQKLIKIKPSLAEAYYNLGVAYYKIKNFAEAIDAFNQTLKIKPDDTDSKFNLELAYGKLYETHGRVAEAINALQRAVKIKQDSFEAYDTLGNLCSKLGRYQEAVDAYERAVKIKTDSYNTLTHLAIAYGILNRWEDSARTYQEAIRIKPEATPSVYYGLGYALAAIGRYQEAIDAYEKAIKSKPDYAEAYLGLGIVHVFLNKKDLALQNYEVLKKLNAEMAGNLLALINKMDTYKNQ